MIPTTASSPILLLNPTATAATGAPATGGEALPDAASSGFELLFGAIQQLPQVLPVQAENDCAESPTGAGELAEGGNALPQSGTILPPVSLQSSPAALQSHSISLQPSAGQISAAAGKDSAAFDAEVEAGELQTIVIPDIVQQLADLGDIDSELKEKSGEDSGRDSLDTDAAVDTAAAGLLPILAVAAPAVATVAASATPLSQAAQIAGSVLPGVGKLARGIGDALAQGTDAGAGSTDSNTQNRSVENAGSNLASLTEAAQATGESDFDALVKQFDEPLAGVSLSTGSATQAGTSANTASAAGQQSAMPLSAPSHSDNSAVNSMTRAYASASNSTAVPVPVGAGGWSDAIADKVMWFSANNISSAEIHLNPPDLGPLQVRVSTQQDQASVVFTSQHVAVRDALDQALPRLREMMNSQGMQLLDVSVGGQNAQQQQQQFGRNDSSERGTAFGGLFTDDAGEAKPVSVSALNTARLSRAGVDAYA